MDDYDDILIHPKKGRKEKPIPAAGILLVNPTEAREWHERVKAQGGRSQFIFHSRLSVAKDDSFFVAGPAIGAPMATMVMEKLIVLGAKKIILFGWCGAVANELQVGSVVVPQYAEAGEGTSQYYAGQSQLVVDEKLFRELTEHLQTNQIKCADHVVWSTDAIFRESRSLLNELNRSKNVGAVDMEFSALCAVASFRGIAFAAVLVVSDELWGKSWRPGFTSEEFMTKKDQVINLLLSMFVK